MFYRPADGHGLPHNPFNAIITPRRSGWSSSKDKDGLANLAPYSFFNGVAYVPPQVMFASTGPKPDGESPEKDSLANIRETGVFAVNVVGHAMMDAMNVSSTHFPHGVDEFGEAGVEMAQCDTIDCPRVANAPATLECRMTQIVRIEGAANHVVFGEVTGIHLRDDCLVDGKFDATKYQPLSRMGYREYTVVRDVFELDRPDD